MSLKETFDHFREEGHVIKKAPFAFISCVLILTGLLVGGVFGFEEWIYRGQLDNDKSQLDAKDATIGEKEATIEQKEETIKNISEQLDAVNRENDRLQNENLRLHSELENGEPSIWESALQKMMTNSATVPVKIVQWRPPELTNGTKYVSIQVGKSSGPVMIPITIDADYQIPFYQFGGHNAINAHISNKRVYLNLDIPTGKIAVEIKDGKSEPLPEGWDWNGDSNALEIVDERGEAVIQEQYLSASVILIQGEIQIGDQIFLTPDENTPFIQQPFTPSMFHPENDDLITIFQYPSSDHFGERLP